MNIADYLRNHCETIWHPVGSCAMGGDPATSSCSPDFRLRGTDNVFVADASVLPSLPSGNPQAAIFAMACLAAASIADTIAS
jgi:choline dehydrogenase